ncbi:MAG TPA: hypothetical protein VHK91_05540 [Flavisolibacter sp.]|jgi:hypothetical protein|nr:hypothetical protein [Flavisolibacter sp.]
MKRQPFTTIEEAHRAHRLIKSGVQVAERTKGFYKIQLYQLPGYYLEVYRHSHFNVIIKVNSFTDVSYLEPYLESIDIASLLG